jgi:predicted nucleic acid-binding protein
VVEKLDWLAAGGLHVAAVDDAIGREAGRLHAAHYDRVRRPLSLADCLALATALTLGDVLATADAPLADAARAEGCSIVALPDSQGRRPS